jgi:N-acetylglutamate synthase-like GNAT family acetyltransferase
VTISPQYLQEKVVRVAESDSTPVGFYSLALWGRALELDLMFVTNSWRRRGVGQTLVADMLEQA